MKKISIMIPNLLRIGVLLTLSKPSIQRSSTESLSYIGAVVEYHPVTDGDDGQMIANANADNYRTIIKNASAYKVDIIVFPEFGLTSLPKDGDKEKKFNETEYRAYYKDTASLIPHPNETVILCDTDSKYKKSLQSISCAAREYKMYVVVNHHERLDCNPKSSNCSSDGFLLYNTNVVFDRTGRVVARYRKYNLFNEIGTNRTAEPEISTFTTDFGVTFGQFICFDILHEKPTINFVKNPNVTDIVYSTHWFDELPFNYATQEQAAWSYAADVNLLASGYSDALTGSGGSGIYAGKGGPIKYYKSDQTSNALVVAEIPKLNRRNRPDDARAGQSFVHIFKQAEVPTISGLHLNLTRYKRMYNDNLKPYTTHLLDPKEGSHITKLCDEGLCCDFHVETTYDEKLAAKPGSKQYSYRLTVFNGVRNYANVSTAGSDVCALVACAGDKIEDCGSIYPEGTDVVMPLTFDSLIITALVDMTKRSFYEPSTLKLSNKSLEPMMDSEYIYVPSGPKNSTSILMSTNKPRNDIITFGIYGRRFDKDGKEATKPKSSATNAESSIFIIMIALTVVLGLKCES